MTQRDPQDAVLFGCITDLHYADVPSWHDRCYRDSLAKMEQAIQVFDERGADFAVCLGDVIDAGPTVEDDRAYLRAIEAAYSRLTCARYYVLGNHDLVTFSKSEFLTLARASDAYGAFRYGGFHFIRLDACFRWDGSDYDSGNFDWTECLIPSHECAWLAAQLARCDGPTVVFVHQRLDEDPARVGYSPANARDVRSILESAGNVVAVFQGHDHGGALSCVGGIHYITLRGAVVGEGLENNAFALVTVRADGTIHVEGHGTQPSFELDRGQ